MNDNNEKFQGNNNDIENTKVDFEGYSEDTEYYANEDEKISKKTNNLNEEETLNTEPKDNNYKNEENGTIKFRKNKKKRRFKGFLKVISFILIGALSGGLGSYFVMTRSNNGVYDYSKNNVSLFKEDTSTTKSNIPYNDINKVAEVAGPTVVGIRNNVEDIYYNQEKTQGTGSGIIFKSDGYIVTNYHVIQGAQKIQVLISGKTEPLEAKIIGYDEISDLAVIKVEAKNLPTAVLGDSSKVRVGDLAVAIGNPLGEEFQGSVTSGIISALNRKIEIPNTKTNQSTIYKVLQTDAAINPGNSGGALCNAKGEIIGINSLKASTSTSGEKDVEGMGFAIPSNEAKTIIESLVKYGKVRRPYLGILGMTATKQVTGSDDVKGVYIKNVISNTGMEAAGVKPGDVIVEVDGKKITNFDDLRASIETKKIGDKVSCKIWRMGKNITKSVTLTEMPGQSDN